MSRYDSELLLKGKVINKCSCGDKAQPGKTVDATFYKTKSFHMWCFCGKRTKDTLTLDEAIKKWNEGDFE